MSQPESQIPIDEDETCADVIEDAIASEPGILNVHLDTQAEQVNFDFDPQRTDAPQIARVAQAVGPPLLKRWETCVMRLEPRGGRSCESCALSLERRVSDVEGVRHATASYRGGVLSVTYDGRLLSMDDLTERIRAIGAPIEALDGAPAEAAEPAAAWPRRGLAWFTLPRLEAILAAVTLIAMILGWFIERAAGLGPWALAAYLVAYVAGGAFGLKGGLESLRQRTLDVDLLMVLAALGAWIIGAPFEGAMLLFLFSLSNVLQSFALDRTRNAIRSLMKLRPKQAVVRRDGQEKVVPIERVRVGDRVLVRPGDALPLDGEVIAGESSVDQASITGESVPVGKRPGDAVFGGTINKNGSLEIRVTKLAKDSTIARLIQLVEEAHSEKAKTQRWIDAFEQRYAGFVILFTLGTFLVPWALLGEAFAPAFYRAITVMVAASPCALVISTPASVLSGIGNGARRGVLFKGGVHLEQAAGIKVVAFDKTGTLTLGRPELTDVQVIGGVSGEDELLRLAGAVQSKSEHALARATVAAAARRDLPLSEAFAFRAATGKGVQGAVDGQAIRVGNLRYFEGFETPDLPAARPLIERFQREGKTSVIVARIEADRIAHMLGVLAFADQLRPQARAVIRDLKAIGVERVVMLTGDNARVAEAIAAQAGVDEVYADLLPEDKVRVLKEIHDTFGPVAMVGDGVNDAPALATASVGMAMGAAGTDVALETADVVLMSDDLHNIPYAIDLSRQTRRTLLVNLGFSLFMIAVMVVSIFTIALPLPLAVLGHEGGTVIVSLNGLRLLAYNRKPRA